VFQDPMMGTAADMWIEENMALSMRRGQRRTLRPGITGAERAEYKRQLEEAKAQSAKIIADAKATGEAVKADITNKAQAESAQMIEKARGAIEAEKKAAVAELQGSIADLSVDVASRLVGHDLNDDEHRKIIEHYVTEAGSFNA